MQANQEVTINGTFLKECSCFRYLCCLCSGSSWLEKKLNQVTSSKYQLKAFKSIHTFFFIDTFKNLTYLLQTPKLFPCPRDYVMISQIRTRFVEQQHRQMGKEKKIPAAKAIKPKQAWNCFYSQQNTNVSCFFFFLVLKAGFFAVFLPGSKQMPFWNKRKLQTIFAKTVRRCWTSHLIPADFGGVVIPHPCPVSVLKPVIAVSTFKIVFGKIFMWETHLQERSPDGFIYQQVAVQ